MVGRVGGAAIIEGHPAPEPDPEHSPGRSERDPRTNAAARPRRRRAGRARSRPVCTDQLKATRDAAMALVMAHVELAKAEAGQIAGEVGRVAALGALAIALVIFAVFLVVIGTSLFLGEWLLGSMGWGVLHGFLLFVSVAMAAVLGALGIAPRRLGGAFARRRSWSRSWSASSSGSAC